MFVALSVFHSLFVWHFHRAWKCNLHAISFKHSSTLTGPQLNARDVLSFILFMFYPALSLFFMAICAWLLWREPQNKSIQRRHIVKLFPLQSLLLIYALSVLLFVNQGRTIVVVLGVIAMGER